MMVVMTMMDATLHLCHNLRMQAGGVSTAWGGFAWVRLGDDFREVDGAAAGVLRDLLAAAEAIGNEDGLGRSGADGGQENAFAESLGDFKLVAFEAEGAGHAAAAGVEQIDVGAGAPEQFQFRCHLHQGFVMAVPLDDDFAAGMLGGMEVRGVPGEKLAEQQGLIAEALSALILREEIDQLIAEDAGAAWFQKDEGEAGVNLRRELVEDAQQIAAGLAE